MSRTRIYQTGSFQPHKTIRLDDNASHHLARVLRANTGDTLTLFNGDGHEYSAIITHIDKKGVDVEIQTISSYDIESPIAIFLAQGIARGEKMDFIVQKAVELGVNKIYPLITERCNVRLEGEREEKKLQHWQSIVISACEQSGRNRIPEIYAPQKFGTWLEEIRADTCFILSPHVSDKLPPKKLITHTSIALLIGPEGGFSDHEMSHAIKKGFQPLNLGPRVLRTETATIAALSALQVKYGDFC